MLEHRRRVPSGRHTIARTLVAFLAVSLLVAGVVAFQSAESATNSMTRVVASSADDAASPDGSVYTRSATTVLIGTGGRQGQPNVSGYRFTNIQVPPGAIIDSVQFSVVKSGTSTGRVVVELAFEATDDAAPFSSASAPRARARTAARALVDASAKRTNGVRYTLGHPSQLAGSLQQVVNRPGWTQGSDVALIAWGPPAPTGAKSAFRTFESGASSAPRLTITWHTVGAPLTATSTSTSTSTATRSPATFTPSPTWTVTQTPKATRTPTSVPPDGTGVTTIEIGAGFSDVSPHQLVRTSANVLYAIVPDCASYPDCPNSRLRAYRADAPGKPTAFTEQDQAHAPSGGIGANAIAIDGEDVIHVLWVDRAGRAGYATFDTLSNRWSALITLAETGWTSFGQGDEGAALALDADGTPHALWNGIGADGKLHIWYAARSAGAWSDPLQVDDVDLAENHKAWHPTIAFTPDGQLLLAWIDGTFNYTPDGVVRVRVRAASGVWGASTALADSAMTAIDNGPSLLVTPDGVRHVTFLNTNNQIRYWYDLGSGWQGDRQPPTQQTHNPALGPDGAGGVYIYGHGTPRGGLAGHGDNLYRMQRPAGGDWGAWTLYVSGAFDSSVSTRWSQFFHGSPATLDILFWADPYPNVLYLGTE